MNRANCLGVKKKKRKNCPESPFYSGQNPLRTSRRNYDFPGWLERSMSLLLELYIFLKVHHVTFYSESHVLMKKKRAGGKTERRRGSHIKFGRGRHLRRWRVTARPSEEQITDCQELHWGSHVPSLFSPHPSKPFTYSSSRRWKKLSTAVTAEAGRRPAPFGCCLLRLDKCVWFLKPAISVTWSVLQGTRETHCDVTNKDFKWISTFSFSETVVFVVNVLSQLQAHFTLFKPLFKFSWLSPVLH